MKKYEYYYTTKPNNCAKYVLASMLAIFFVCVATFALIEIHDFYTDKSSIVKILTNSFKNSESSNNLTPNNVLIEEAERQAGERQARAVLLSSEQNSTTSTTEKSNFYYEEQRPVVVYSRTDAVSPIANKQLHEVPPRQDSDNDDEDPYRNPSTEDDDYDYFGQPAEQPQPYYRQPQQQQPESYYRSHLPTNGYYRSPPYPHYFDDSREDFPAPEQNSEEARASQYRDYNNNYYRQWPYATPPPANAAIAVGGSSSTSDRLTPTRSGQQNNKMQMMSSIKGQQQQPQNRDPYPAYMDDYDYNMPHQAHSPQPYPFAQYKTAPPQRHQLQQQHQKMPQYRTPSSIQAEEKQIETRPQMDVLTIIKSLKSMWDIYQSFTTSWNTIAERRNREEELAKQKYEQLQRIRINSKKPPPKFNNKRNQTATTKSPRKQTTTTTTTTVAPTSDSWEMYTSSEEDVMIAKVKKQPPAKVEPRKQAKGDKTKAKTADGLREKRQAVMEDAKGTTDVGEGRYIKGDPLKGYYDFVITEGSYKFWAAFQVGTAILIIYSTFAAIYYSKVNPLVSDYDYTDYLGGARSLSGGDLDFVDDDDGTTQTQKAQSNSWLKWLPRTGHSLKLILDAIDKLPTDHEEAETMSDLATKTKENYSSNSGEISNNDYENRDNSQTDYEQSEDVEIEKQEGIVSEENTGVEGSGSSSVEEIQENRDNIKILAESAEYTDDDNKDQHNKAM